MNISTSESTLVVHFSAAKVDHVDELDGVLVGYDERDRIVDVAVRAKTAPARVDFVEEDHGAVPARVSYDGEFDVIAVDWGASPYAGSDEILPDFIVDFDDDGFVRGLEFLNASHFFLRRNDFGRSQARHPARNRNSLMRAASILLLIPR
jgi:Protein of unknown function (DUF2283)